MNIMMAAQSHNRLADGNMTSLKTRPGDRKVAHLSVKTTRPHQSVIQDVSSVGGCNDNDASVALKAVHLCQQLVQSLLTLIVASTNTSSTRSVMFNLAAGPGSVLNIVSG